MVWLSLKILYASAVDHDARYPFGVVLGATTSPRVATPSLTGQEDAD